jgi:hypothetical protein
VKPDLTERGAARLFQFAASPEPAKKFAPATAATAATAPSTTPQTPAGPALADMEAQLVAKIEITQDDLRDLMNQRAKTVQAFLLQTGKVTAERLFVTAPKPMDLSSKGEDKVNLSLE